ANTTHTVTLTYENAKGSVDTIRIANGALGDAPVIDIKTYKLTTSAVNATITAGTTYPESATATTKVSFAANTGYEITQITVDGTVLSGTELSTAVSNGYVTVDHTKDHSVTVTAAAKTFTVTNTATNAVIDTSSSYIYSETAKTSVSFAPNTGYEITGITVDGTALSGTELSTAIANGFVSVDNTADHTVNVTATIKSFTVTTSAVNASIDASSSYTYSATAVKTVSFSAASGYEITQIIIDGTALFGTELSTAIANGCVTVSRTANHTVAVTAEQVSTNPSEAVIFDCETEYSEIEMTNTAESLVSTSYKHSGDSSYGLVAKSSATLEFHTASETAINISTNPDHASISFWADVVSSRLKLSSSGAVKIIVGSDASDASKQCSWVINRSAFTNNTWTQITLPFASATYITYTEGANVDFSNLCYISVSIVATGAVAVYFDDFVITTDAGYTTTVTKNFAVYEDTEILTCDEVDTYIKTITAAETLVSETEYKAGTGAYNLSTATGSLTTYAETARANVFTLSAKDTSRISFKFWVYLSSTTDLNSMTFVLSSSASSTSNIYKWTFNTSNAYIGWNEYTLTFSDDNLTTSGSPSVSAINYFRISFSAAAAMDIYFDNLRVSNASSSNTFTMSSAATRIAQMENATSFTPIYNIDATDSVFGADPTGNTSSTTAIQNALNACFAAGGGTVYLPAGIYKLTGGIQVPAYCTLLGDYQDPDLVSNPTYGTIIMYTGSTSSDEVYGMFSLHSSSGVNGLTVYYTDQSVSNVKSYAPVFANPGTTTSTTLYGKCHELATVKNVTVINGYRGLSASTNNTSPANYVHETFTVENVKGTFLNYGMKSFNSSDVDTYTSITVSPKYWANANTSVLPGITSQTEAEISAYTKENATGLILGDLEWAEFYNINLSGLAYGIHIVFGSGRAAFSGSMSEAEITNCTSGITVDYYDGTAYVNTMDTRWGFAVSNSVIEGGINNQSDGIVKTCNCTISGSTTGISTYNGASSIVTVTEDEINTSTKTTGTAVKSISAGSGASVIQAALDYVGSIGGGVVYVEGGYYTINQVITVPANVELRGSSASPVRGENRGAYGGTVFCIDYGTDAIAAADNAIVLGGINAGVSGIRFADRTNLNALTDAGIANENYTSLADSAYGYDLDLTPYVHGYMILGEYANNYVTNCEIVGAYNGIKLTGSGHAVKNINVWCMHNAFRLSGGGIIQNCLNNGTLGDRTGYSLNINGTSSGIYSPDTYGVSTYNGISKKNLVYLIVDSGTEKVLNCFAFGAHHGFYCNGGTTYLVNTAVDQLGYVSSSRSGGYGIVADGTSTVYSLNMLRVYGSSYYQYSGTTLHIYNRLTINNKTEANV
ncbi:MAG: glycosyl hydrolase family 28-related protein, partial [Acutalibacteraceae bacterium]